MALDVGFVGGEVRLRTGSAEFFVGEQHHADGAPGFDVEIFDELRHAHHDGDTRAVIDRTDARIPGVEVRAKDHDFTGEVGAREFRRPHSPSAPAANRASCS